MNRDHRAAAEVLLTRAARPAATADDYTRAMTAAQVHATLAAGATAAADTASYRHAIHTYRYALIRQIAEGLALSEGDEAHQHARGLAQYLDSVDLNVDREVDAYIEGLGWSKPTDAWLSPSDRQAKWANVAGDDPWADHPDL